MKVGWGDFERELNAWSAAGRVATFWWRDDDTSEPTPPLDRLLRLADRLRVPVAIAVIPEPATPELAARLAHDDSVTVLQHGWRHANHAPAGEKRAELGPHRPLADIFDDLARGRERLRELLGEPAPFLVPPWNRIAPAVASGLPRVGFAGLSAFGARASGPTQGIMRANCHLDPVDWRGTRGFVGEELALTAAIRHLHARREERTDPEEPTGLLTHHLIMDEGCWHFVEALITRSLAGGRARWLTAEAAFSTDRPFG